MRRHTIQIMGYLYVFLSMAVLLLIAYFGVAQAADWFHSPGDVINPMPAVRGMHERSDRFSYRDEAFIYRNAAHDVALLKACGKDSSEYVRILTEQTVVHGANAKQRERLNSFLEKEVRMLEPGLQAQGCHEEAAENADLIIQELMEHRIRWIDVVYAQE